MRVRAVALAAVLAGIPGGAALACAFHPTFANAISVAYPGSLKVAVAIADARERKLLPPAGSQRAATGAQCLASAVAERRSSPLARTKFPVSSGESCAYTAALGRLQDLGRRFELAIGNGADDSGTEFSLVLVGPRLWSHYRLADRRVLAAYHVDGPLEERAVVLTDDAVLSAILDGSLDVGQAIEAGLISVAGPGHAHLSRLIEKALTHG